MKWEDIDLDDNILGIEATDVECPICGEHLYRDTSVCYTSDPPKYKYFCIHCQFVGYNYWA